MSSLIGSMTLWMAVSSTGGIFFNRNPNAGVLPPQPGFGVGFANGNPDGYGWVNFGDQLPLTADRVPDYFYRRYRAVPATQMFFPTYYNPYISRGQRFMPYAGCGGPHPMSTPPVASAEETVHPYSSTVNNVPQTTEAPSFSGKVDAPPVNPGSTGLRP